MRNRILSASIVLMAACGAGDTGPTDAASEPAVSTVGDTAVFTLPVGRTVRNGDFSIRFEAVTTDSRCPRQVECVWEGNAGIRLTLSSDGTSELVLLNTALSPQAIRFAGRIVRFRDLSPYPTSETPIDDDAYVATVTVIDAPPVQVPEGDEPSPDATPPPQRYID